jgi:NADH-quinone oxidoreductase subunit G
VTFATHEGPFVAHADVALPVSSWAESDGTFVNAKGISQQSERAILPQGASRPAFKVIAACGRALGYPIALTKLADVRAAMQSNRAPASSPRPTTGAPATP